MILVPSAQGRRIKFLKDKGSAGRKNRKKFSVRYRRLLVWLWAGSADDRLKARGLAGGFARISSLCHYKFPHVFVGYGRELDFTSDSVITGAGVHVPVQCEMP